MLGFLVLIFYKVIRWALVTAAVLTYIEIGYGGESLGSIVSAIKQVLINIDWASLLNEIWLHIKELANVILDQVSKLVGDSNA